MKATEIAAAIEAATLTEDQIRDLWAVLKYKFRDGRRKKQAIAIATLKKGDRVRITNIRPAKLKGLAGTVDKMTIGSGGKARVSLKITSKWIEPSVQRHIVDGILSGIPVGCLTKEAK